MSALAAWLGSLPEADGIRWASTAGAFDAFERRYLAVREREGRLYDDATAARLPQAPPGRLQGREWQQRAASAHALARHLQRRGVQSVLEVGCGNGWLARLLAAATNAAVVGLDVNMRELRQAARVSNPPAIRRTGMDLTWVHGDLFDPGWPDAAFDAIVFASALQYFEDAPAAIRRALALARPAGEVHVLDTMLYAREEIAAAAARTRAYYAGLGIPDAADNYFAHGRDPLLALGARVLFDPAAPMARLLTRSGLSRRGPFPWLCWSKP